MMKKNKIEVAQDQENMIETKVLAKSIVDIGAAMKILSQGRLKREAIITLVKDKTGLTKADIRLVLDSLESLEKDWLK